MNLSARKINAIFGLKFKSIARNYSIMMTPLLAIAMVLMFKALMPEMNAPGMNKIGYLLSFGAAFNTIMGGIMMSSYPLAEEKEKNTLRVLLTSSVNGVEYLIGSALPGLIIIMIVSVILIPLSGASFTNIHLGMYLLLNFISTVISMLIGYVIGIYCKNQMQSGIMATPVMLVIMMVGFFSPLNDTIEKISSFFYSGILNDFMFSITLKTASGFEAKDILVLLGWIVVTAAIFLFAYRQHGLE